jgi:hypothetical protein
VNDRRLISLKRSDVCCLCRRDLPSGYRVFWDIYSRTISCTECAEPLTAEEADRMRLRAGGRNGQAST